MRTIAAAFHGALLCGAVSWGAAVMGGRTNVASAVEAWPQFRGPAGQAIVTGASAPTEWSMSKNLVWKIAVPGVGWSQPIVWGDKVYVTTAVTENQSKPRPGGGFGGPGGRGPRPDGQRPRPEGDRPGGQPPAERPDNNPPAPGAPPPPGGERPQGRGPGGPGPGGFGPGGPGRGFGRNPEPPKATYQWKLVCLNAADGKQVWETLAHEGRPAIATHGSNTYASETPITDGERIYAYFGMTGVFCFDMAGKQVWKKELGSFPMRMGWGTGSSPLLHGGLLYVLCDNEQKSFLVALDAKTGDEKWRASREERSGWSSPYLWKNKQRTELIANGGAKVISYDPATGKVLWELGGLNGQSSATPVGDDELLYFGVGRGAGARGPLAAVRAGATGTLSLDDTGSPNSAVAWTVASAGPAMSSPLLYQGLLYVFDQRGGGVSCFDAKTGKQHFRERIPNARGFTSSPWAADGKVFCLDEDGSTFVLQAGPELKVLATNKLDDMFWSSAAVVGDKILLRGVNTLFCVGK